MRCCVTDKPEEALLPGVLGDVWPPCCLLQLGREERSGWGRPDHPVMKRAAPVPETLAVPGGETLLLLHAAFKLRMRRKVDT